MLRFLLSKIIPVPMNSTYALSVSGEAVREGGNAIGFGNHYRDDDHHDLVSARWWQWRGRCFRQHTRSICIG
jgi:hypothetical protein